MSILVVNEEEHSFIWDSISNLQLIFHPRLSRDGIVDYQNLSNLYNKKINVLLDRNLLSSLLNLSRDGYLKNETEMRIVALLMTWVLMNRFPVSAGLALKEYATKFDDIIGPKLELQEFNNIFEYYPSMLWLRLAEGQIDQIPICSLPITPFATEIKYNEADNHLLMHIAEMLHVVYLCKRNDLSPVDKMVGFLRWNYKNLLICESTLVYVAMLFTNQSGIKAPKNSGSKDIENIMSGCKNQAWDLSYLSNWSCFHYDEKNTKDVFLFATNDNLLKMIFINTYAEGGFGALIEALFSKIHAQKIYDVINDNQRVKRVKPNFGDDPKIYFRWLIEQEKQRVVDLLKTF